MSVRGMNGPLRRGLRTRHAEDRSVAAQKHPLPSGRGAHRGRGPRKGGRRIGVAASREEVGRLAAEEPQAGGPERRRRRSVGVDSDAPVRSMHGARRRGARARPGPPVIEAVEADRQRLAAAALRLKGSGQAGPARRARQVAGAPPRPPPRPHRGGPRLHPSGRMHGVGAHVRADRPSPPSVRADGPKGGAGGPRGAGIRGRSGLRRRRTGPSRRGRGRRPRRRRRGA